MTRNFREYQRNSKWNFQRSIKKELEFPGVIKKKICEDFRGLGSFPNHFQEEYLTHEKFSVVKLCFSLVWDLQG